MSVFNLTWREPFTWDNFPIISYTITIVLTNYSDQREAINVEMFDITSTEDHQYQHSIKGKECYVVNFFVAATNSIGNGECSSVQYSNSIGKTYYFIFCVILSHTYSLAEVGEIGNIETTINFLSNGTPHFWMSFLVNLKFSKTF